MRRYALRCMGAAGPILTGDAEPPIGAYLASYNPEAHDGMGFAVWCDGIEDALLVADSAALFALWQRIPENRPLRDDGLPNRPLTVFTVEVVPVEVT